MVVGPAHWQIMWMRMHNKIVVAAKNYHHTHNESAAKDSCDRNPFELHL